MQHHPTSHTRPTTPAPPAAPEPRTRRPARPLRGIDVPTTIWLPPAHLPAVDDEGDVLPSWARTRLAAEHAADSSALTATWHSYNPDSFQLRPLEADSDELAGSRHRTADRVRLVLLETNAGATIPAATQPYPDPAALAAARQVLAPGGVLAIALGDDVTGPGIGLLAHAVRAAREAGFTYQQHVLIVTANLDGDRVIPRPTARSRARHLAQRVAGLPVSHRTHRDLFLFTAPEKDHRA